MVRIGFRLRIGSGIPAAVRPRFAEELEEFGCESFWFSHFISRDIYAFEAVCQEARDWYEDEDPEVRDAFPKEPRKERVSSAMCSQG